MAIPYPNPNRTIFAIATAGLEMGKNTSNRNASKQQIVLMAYNVLRFARSANGKKTISTPRIPRANHIICMKSARMSLFAPTVENR